MNDQLLADQALIVARAVSRLFSQFKIIDVDDPAMDLPAAQLRVCIMLRKGPRTMSVLSRELGITLSAITQVADRLERSGLVERVAEADDRRIKCLRLTDHGADIMRCRGRKRTERVAEMLEHLSVNDRENVVSALQILLRAVLATLPEEPEDDISMGDSI